MSEDEIDPKHAMDFHNIKQVLELIKMITGKNSEMPIFIIKLYTVWMHRTLTDIAASKTLMPKEDIDIFRKLYMSHFETASGIIEDMLKNVEDIERLKISKEQENVGM